MLRKTCSCPWVYECPDCGDQRPQMPGDWGQSRRCKCDEQRELMERMQREAGEKCWGEIGPIIETWNLKDPEITID